MFGIGGPELIVIIVLALILVGPDQLPKVVKTVGTGVRDLRRMANLAQAELRETVDDLVRDIEAEPEDLEPAQKARAEAQRRAAAAVAAARARGADGPPAAIEPTATHAEASADTAGASDVTAGPAAQAADASLQTANAVPTAPPPAAPSAGGPGLAQAATTSLAQARTQAEERANKRKEIGQLLAEEAAKLQTSRAKALADASHFESQGLRNAQPAAASDPGAHLSASASAPTRATGAQNGTFGDAPVAGAVARSASPARPGSLAAAMQRATPTTPDVPEAAAAPTTPKTDGPDEADA